MKINLFLAAAVAASSAVWADEGEEQAEEPVANAVESIQKKAKFFSTLPVCSVATGEVEVHRPGAAWEKLEVGRRYPLGSEYRTHTGASMTLSFGPTTLINVGEKSHFVTRTQKFGEDIRSIVLKGGSVKVVLPRNLPAGAFSIAASGFTVKDLAGESHFTYTVLGDGDNALLRCLTGTFVVEGRNFSVPRMGPTQEFRIRTSHDVLNTILYGVRGDPVIKVDRGIVTRTEIDEDGKVKNVYEKSILDWRLSPQTRVQLNRAVPAIGSKLAVSVMTFDADGVLKNDFAYTEDNAAVNSGELVPVSKEESDKLAKRAAEATGAAGAADAANAKTEGGENADEDASGEGSEESEENNEQEEE